jgi:hypothetical protein
VGQGKFALIGLGQPRGLRDDGQDFVEFPSWLVIEMHNDAIAALEWPAVTPPDGPSHVVVCHGPGIFASYPHSGSYEAKSHIRVAELATDPVEFASPELPVHHPENFGCLPNYVFRVFGMDRTLQEQAALCDERIPGFSGDELGQHILCCRLKLRC